MGPAVDFAELCDRLRKLGERPPSAAGRRELDAALGSKWEGVQVTAARSLAAWGDARAIERVWGVLEELCGKRSRWSATGAVAAALAPHHRAIGVTRVLGLYIERCRSENRFALWHLTDVLPDADAASELERRLRTSDGEELREATYLLRRLSSIASTRGPGRQ